MFTECPYPLISQMEKRRNKKNSTKKADKKNSITRRRVKCFKFQAFDLITILFCLILLVRLRAPGKMSSILLPRTGCLYLEEVYIFQYSDTEPIRSGMATMNALIVISFNCCLIKNLIRQIK